MLKECVVDVSRIQVALATEAASAVATKNVCP